MSTGGRTGVSSTDLPTFFRAHHPQPQNAAIAIPRPVIHISESAPSTPCGQVVPASSTPRRRPSTDEPYHRLAEPPSPCSDLRKHTDVTRREVPNMAPDNRPLALAKSILGHRDGRLAEEVLTEVELAIYGATISDLQTIREMHLAGDG